MDFRRRCSRWGWPASHMAWRCRRTNTAVVSGACGSFQSIEHELDIRYMRSGGGENEILFQRLHGGGRHDVLVAFVQRSLAVQRGALDEIGVRLFWIGGDRLVAEWDGLRRRLAHVEHDRAEIEIGNGRIGTHPPRLAVTGNAPLLLLELQFLLSNLLQHRSDGRRT